MKTKIPLRGWLIVGGVLIVFGVIMVEKRKPKRTKSRKYRKLK